MGSAIEGVNIMQRIRDAHTLVGNLAEELIRMENEDKDGFWSDSDFFDLTWSFLASLKAMGFEIEPESFGEKLINAMNQDDVFQMSRFRFELMSNIRKLQGAKRSGYMFFVFWPQLHTALNAEPE
ncbi:MAG: hypothetical protein C4516_10205 [Oxalobacter sp.]|jgi:hypothetical protein|nr:MAG: hypothetical protein C4516_10205 [Oxalobacter sp.]